MNKLGILFFIFIVGISGFVFAESDNDAQQIIGTWKNFDSTVDFYSNGTFVLQFENHPPINGSYFVSGSKVIITQDSRRADIYDFYISGDGRILFSDWVYDRKWFVKQSKGGA